MKVPFPSASIDFFRLMAFFPKASSLLPMAYSLIYNISEEC